MEQVQACNPPVNSLAGLKNAVQEIWDSILQEDICALTNSTPRQLAAIIQNFEGNMSY